MDLYRAPVRKTVHGEGETAKRTASTSGLMIAKLP
jgi:hypothetical protein